MRLDRQTFYRAIKRTAKELGEAGFHDWLSSLDADTHSAVVAAFSDPAFGLSPYQYMPEGEWRVWFLQMGRGTGKTHAASCAANEMAEMFEGGIGLLVGATVKDVRDTMIQGPSGIVATARPDFVPHYSERVNTVFWPNGSKAYVRTADNPEDIRGPTVNWAWCDELVKWRSGVSYDNVELCVREMHEFGTKIIVTTTPKQAKQWIKDICDKPGTIVSRASTLDNPHLDPSYLASVRAELATGSRKAREEILGEWTTGDSQLWDREQIEALRDPVRVSLKSMAASMERLVISVDPAGGKGKDETGILLIGYKAGRAYVLEDYTTGGSTQAYTDKIVEIAKTHEFQARDYVLIETNFDAAAQTVLYNKNRSLRVVPVTSHKSKWVRAQEAYAHTCADKVRFWNSHPKLEQQLVEWEPEMKKSPDRGDAFTQAVNHLCKQSTAPKVASITFSGLRL